MIGAIIQARLGSTRLPGKVLREAVGKPLLQLMLERVKKSRGIEKIAVAIPDSDENRAISELCARMGVEVFKGSENDVLSRYYLAAKQYSIDPVVRLTSDCPLIDPALIDHALGIWQDGEYDYLTNAIERTYPDGEDIEIISFSALEKAYLEANDAHDREHVTTFIGCRGGIFRLGNFRFGKDLSELRWTVDYEKDYLFVKKIFEELYRGEEDPFTMQDILNLLERKPEIAGINLNVKGKDNLKLAKEKIDKLRIK